jgi:glycerol kinase
MDNTDDPYETGLAVGFWPDTDSLKKNRQAHTTWHPDMDDDLRTRLYDRWRKAVDKSFEWC